ncbi:MAG: 50S ribosomal protein L17 [Planctomycetota bacterium]
MMHGKKWRKLGRKAHHYRMLQQNLVTALFQHERIITTDTKAKEFRSAAEKLITRAKEYTLHNFRQVLSMLQNEEITNKLFKEIAPRFKDRPGGYTRIIKLGGSRIDMKGGKNLGKWVANRLKDNAPRVIWELVEKSKTEPKDEKKAKTAANEAKTAAKEAKTVAKEAKAKKEPPAKTKAKA